MVPTVCSGRVEVSYALHKVLGLGLKASLAEIFYFFYYKVHLY